MQDIMPIESFIAESTSDYSMSTCPSHHDFITDSSQSKIVDFVPLPTTKCSLDFVLNYFQYQSIIVTPLSLKSFPTECLFFKSNGNCFTIFEFGSNTYLLNFPLNVRNSPNFYLICINLSRTRFPCLSSPRNLEVQQLVKSCTAIFKLYKLLHIRARVDKIMSGNSGLA